MLIPFTRPYVSKAGLVNLQKVVNSSHHCGDGFYTEYCSQLLEKALGCGKVLMTSSCTHAIELAALLLELSPGDEVLIPSFAFPSCANAFVLRGANPIFCDSNLETGNIDVDKLESLITERTRAILLIHYGGVACDMDKVVGVARKNNLTLIEDLAHGPFASYGGKKLGTFGDLATLSFHHTKNFSSGEGGALIINNKKYLERAEIMREKGTNRSKFMRGQVDKYTWVDVGSSYLPSEFQMAILAGALDDRFEVQSERMAIWDRYFNCLNSWAIDNGVALPSVPMKCSHSAHVFYLRLPSLRDRTRFIAFMRDRKIDCPFHYQSLDNSPMGLNFFSSDSRRLAKAELLSNTLVRLPLWFGLSAHDQGNVIDAVSSFSI
ncbi:dTDP-4-amino-4,6-dideoxygalactose transaminase [Polynucleobacter sp. AP-Jannik-300A-C4]|nr:dTDP-4-amino-4,6-dideoxygalactose transaminase [Polynucleobacter sp. AP-Jannik-300A-C4]